MDSEDDISCEICLEQYDSNEDMRNPYNLDECGHTMCKSCITRLSNRSQGTCPMFRTIFKIKKIKKESRAFIKLIESSRSKIQQFNQLNKYLNASKQYVEKSKKQYIIDHEKITQLEKKLQYCERLLDKEDKIGYKDNLKIISRYRQQIQFLNNDNDLSNNKIKTLQQIIRYQNNNVQCYENKIR